MAAVVAADLAAHDDPAASRSLGMRWSPQRARAELAALRRALVPPEQAEFELRDASILITSGEPEVREYWVVAQEPEGTIVFYDEDEEEFGLAQLTRRGTRETTGIRGELVDVFMAR
ncbi:MAG: hypothetical protein IPI38_07560 [Gemmatimonadetes bacterium]|nr:hypothetical protein [Gemmatimonadota bacterium]MBK7786451.1 hypothetical protein [Gemmatimonadota bacterium]MBK9065836.1 hypothetical protein [Gemmatimonadota bacterium]MBP6669625.1 hypothetical protein [Gemmatimonadales bacterium]